MDLELNFLGTGTSTGVPMLACGCRTCCSDDPRDRRLRSSLTVTWGSHRLVIDTTPEFRLQMLRAGADRLDAVLLTHTHADHIHGFDDLRCFSFATGSPIPVYGSGEALAFLRQHFRYIWEAKQVGGGLPKVDLQPVSGPFKVVGLTVTPIPVLHGVLEIYGYRVGNAAYISDVSEIPETSYHLLEGLDVLIIDAVRYRPHRTHFHLEAALAAARRIGAGHTYLTHLNHDFLHAELEAELPPGVTPAHDTLAIRCTG